MSRAQEIVVDGPLSMSAVIVLIVNLIQSN